MRPWPYEVLVVRSPLARDDLARRLRAAVDAPRLLDWLGGDRPLIGRAEGCAFKVRRRLGFAYRNSFLPIAIGAVKEDADGAFIEARLRLHQLVAAFMVVWMSGALAGSVAAIVATVRGGAWAALTVLVMPAAGYALVQLGFWREVPRLRQVLLEIAAAGRGALVRDNPLVRTR